VKAKALPSSSHKGRHLRLARWGETLALVWLWLKGYRLEARNWRCTLGELDLVMRRRELLVFVEVKTRTSRQVGLPEEAVSLGKQAQLARVAKAYLSQRRGTLPPCRFDVVAVELAGFFPRLRHHRGAFLMRG
jgi:putative endonuclease